MWCWPQPFGQPLILMWRFGASAAISRVVAQVLAEERPRPRDCVTARRHDSAPGQLVTSDDGVGAGEAQAGGGEPRVEPVEIGLAHPAEQQVLFGGHAHRAVAVGLREVGEDAQLVAGQVAEDRRDDRHHVARPASAAARWSGATSPCSAARRRRIGLHDRDDAGAAQVLRLADAGDDVEHARRLGARASRARPRPAGSAGRSGSRRAALAAELRQLVPVLLDEAIPAHRLDEELHPVALLVLVVAVAVIDADDRLGDVEHLARRDERLEQRAVAGHRRGAAADGDAEAADAVLDLRRTSRCR